MIQQDSIAPLASDTLTMQLLNEFISRQRSSGRVNAVPLHPGDNFIMPMPEDSAAAGTGADLLKVLNHTYFTEKDSTLRTDLPYRSYGVAGAPVPYTVRGDNAITTLLILCFVLFVVSVAHSRSFIGKQLKNFFRETHNSDSSGETGGELHFQTFLVMVDCLVLAISSYLWATQAISGSFMFQTDLTLIAILTGLFALFFALRWLAGTIVNLTFFGVKKNLQWIKLQLLVTACEGVLLFPMLLLLVYFDFPEENALYYFGFVLFLNKILTFYKCWLIFFKQNSGYLQNILYFCALEIAPLLAFGGAWLALIDLLKVNF
jgi:hypothetical protein